jgi:hypothetical protein
VVAEQAHGEKRFASWEAVALGPLYGTGMLPAAGAAAAREAAVLDLNDLTPAQITRLHGERRAIRFQPVRSSVDPAGSDLTLVCELPTDAYVSELLAEFLAPAPDSAAAAGDAEDAEGAEGAEGEDAEPFPGDEG